MLAQQDYLDIGRYIADTVQQTVVPPASRRETQDTTGALIDLIWTQPDKTVRLILRVNRLGIHLLLMSGEMIIDDDLVASCPVVAQWGVSQRRSRPEIGQLMVGEAQKTNPNRLYLEHPAVSSLCQDRTLLRIDEAVATAVETQLNSA